MPEVKEKEVEVERNDEISKVIEIEMGDEALSSLCDALDKVLEDKAGFNYGEREAADAFLSLYGV